MKKMTPRTRLFTPLLVLACATSGAWAGKKAFNIHDDLLAFPQVCLDSKYWCILKRYANYMLSGYSFKFISPMNTFSNRKQRSCYSRSTAPPSDGPTRNKRRSTWERIRRIQKNAIMDRTRMDRCYLTKK